MQTVWHQVHQELILRCASLTKCFACWFSSVYSTFGPFMLKVWHVNFLIQGFLKSETFSQQKTYSLKSPVTKLCKDKLARSLSLVLWCDSQLAVHHSCWRRHQCIRWQCGWTTGTQRPWKAAQEAEPGGQVVQVYARDRLKKWWRSTTRMMPTLLQPLQEAGFELQDPYISIHCGGKKDLFGFWKDFFSN